MAARKVLRMGHPLLLEKSHEVRQFSTKELQRLIRDLHDTMHAEEGAGIAAPQIGVLRRVVIFGVEKNNSRYPDRGEIPETILINPIITPLSDELEEGWEGCLSVPGMRGLVKRYSRVRYQGFDENGEKIHREVDGFHARVVQHECDHLDGILYPMRIGDMREFGFKEELKDKIGC
ncbi:MAG: peptide deformylase [Gammaproteobacteria bacterium]|jgi:peptide deformylase